MELQRQQCQLLTAPARRCRGHGGVLVEVERALDPSKQLGGVQVIAKPCVSLSCAQGAWENGRETLGVVLSSSGAPSEQPLPGSL